MRHLRFTLRLLALALTLAGYLALHGLWRLLRLHSPWPPRFLGSVARICGARARVTGAPLRRDVVFVSNHLSWLDILLIAGATGSTFVAKAELSRAPLVGWLCGLNDTLFVERGDRMGVGAQIEQLRATLRGGRPVTLFPEGTTDGGGRTLLPFKAALFAALDPAPPGVRVQPVMLDYGNGTDELAWVGAETGQHHVSRVLRRRGTFAATLCFLEPFDPAALPGRKAIAAEARRRMEHSETLPVATRT